MAVVPAVKGRNLEHLHCTCFIFQLRQQKRMLIRWILIWNLIKHQLRQWSVVDGNEPWVERHRIARFPTNRTSSLPFPCRRRLGGCRWRRRRRRLVTRCRLLLPLLQHLLHSVGQVVTSGRFTIATIRTSSASINVHHVTTNDIVSWEAE